MLCLGLKMAACVTPSRWTVSLRAASVLSAAYQPEFCLSPIEKGTCDGSIRRYLYNPRRKRCQAFHYSGCGGNRNNFGSKRQCVRTCMKGSARRTPPPRGYLPPPPRFCSLTSFWEEQRSPTPPSAALQKHQSLNKPVIKTTFTYSLVCVHFCIIFIGIYSHSKKQHQQPLHFGTIHLPTDSSLQNIPC